MRPYNIVVRTNIFLVKKKICKQRLPHISYKVSRLDGSYRTVVISKDLGDPRGIAVYPAKGLMFWTDNGRRAKVERSSMDGTGRQPLVQGGSVQSPIGITLDYQEDKVYWVDESLDIIWKMDLDGGECLTKDEGFSSGKGT